MTVDAATAGVNSSLTRLRAVGIEIIGTTLFTPKAAFIEPAICLYLGTFISAKDSRSTKKAISNVAISAKVAIHAGAPPLGQAGQGFGGEGPAFFGSSGSASGSSSGSSSGSNSGSSSASTGSSVSSSAMSQLSCYAAGASFVRALGLKNAARTSPRTRGLPPS